jgi:hypothetical protein
MVRPPLGFPVAETKEVLNMNKNQTKEQELIDVEELPEHPCLQPIRVFDGIYPEDEEERQAYWDFVTWTMTREHAVLLSIPQQKNESDIWQNDLDEFGNDSSAFNTMDYQKLHPSTFNKYQYRLTKICEKIKDLALLHSCISQPEGKQNTWHRFKGLVEKEFRDEAILFVETYKKYPHLVNKDKLLERVSQLNSKIRKCKQIWQEYAHTD